MCMCVCVYIYTHVCMCTYIHTWECHICHPGHFQSWKWCVVPWINLVIRILGTMSLQASKQLLWPVIAPELTVHRRCLGGTGRQLPQQEVCDYFAIKNCPKPEGFHSRRNVITPSITKLLTVWFCKTDSGWSLRQESLSHTSIDSNPLISLRKTYSLHVLLITQQGRPCSACSTIWIFTLPSVLSLWERTKATLLDLLVVMASAGLPVQCS